MCSYFRAEQTSRAAAFITVLNVWWMARSNGVMRSDRLAEKTKRVAAFKTDCSWSCSWPEILKNRVAVVHLADNQCTNQGQQGLS